MTPERILGRGLACCCHPCLAWRVLGRRGRAGLVAAYGVAGYVVTFVLLLAGG